MEEEQPEQWDEFERWLFEELMKQVFGPTHVVTWSPEEII